MQLISNKKGNTTVMAMFSVTFLVIVFLCLYDVSRLYIYREQTKKASEAVCLAAAQDKIFFQDGSIEKTLGCIIEKNGCKIGKVNINYDEVTAEAEKRMEFLLLGIFFKKDVTVRSVSKVKVYYPWDDRFDYCDTYYFDYGRD